jgi:hypothetical protein
MWTLAYTVMESAAIDDRLDSLPDDAPAAS